MSSGLAEESCDVLIVGAGPAGLAAAAAAAPSGARIVVIDDNPAPGGQVWRQGPGVVLPAAGMRLLQDVAGRANVRILAGTRVVGANVIEGTQGTQGTQSKQSKQQLLLEDASHAWRLRSDKLILCTGARELLLPFPGWTLSGVTGAGGLQALVKGGMPVAGERIVVAGSGPLLLAAAATAARAGARVVRVAEQAPWRSVAGFAAQLYRWPAKVWQALALGHAGYRADAHVLSAAGEGRVASVRLQRGPGRVEDLACDRLACGFGLVPNTELGRLLGCGVVQHGGSIALATDATFATTVPGIHAAGECTGIGGGERAALQGTAAGFAAVGLADQARALQPALARWNIFAASLQLHFTLSPALRQLAAPDTLLCRCEDVPFDIVARRTDWTDAKLHTRCGMGPCQGRVCGAAAQFLFGWAPLVPRPPLSPVRIGTLAGLDTNVRSP